MRLGSSIIFSLVTTICCGSAESESFSLDVSLPDDSSALGIVDESIVLTCDYENGITMTRTSPLWSNNAELGAEVAYKPDARGLQTVLHLKEWGMPTLWTVALGIAFDPKLIPGAGDGQFSVDALVQFGSGKVKQEFEADWAEGTTFSLPCNTVKIVARYSDFVSKNNTPKGLRLRANLAQGGSIEGNATKTVKVVVPKSSHVNGIPIPRFARRLSVQNGLGPSGKTHGAWSDKVLYRFMGGASVSGDTGSFTGEQFITAFAERGVPIPASARSIIVQNNTTSDFSSLLIFHLAF
jgi:hypothetical protein